MSAVVDLDDGKKPAYSTNTMDYNRHVAEAMNEDE
jgi:hypothetical protein